MDYVRIGLAGCGSFGEDHLQAFQAIPQARVTAVYDLVLKKAEEAARAFGIPKVCETIEELCQYELVDAVDVVTAEDAHLEPVLKAMAASKHVFVEKPFALDLTHCQQMIEAAEGADRILMVGHILRFETKYGLLKEEVDSGRLGRIVSMHARRNRPKMLLERYGRVHPVIVNSVHDIDLMIWFVQKPVRRVRGYGRKTTGGKYDDTFWGVIEFEGGAVGVVETIWLLPKAGGVMMDDALQLIGECGVGHLSLFPGALTWWREDGFGIPDISYNPRLHGAARGALRDELAYFCDCVQRNIKPDIITPREAKNAIRVGLALIDSASRDADVNIKEWD